MASWFPESNENLVEQGIEAPVAAVHCAGVKVGVETVVVPKTGLVIAEQAAVARQAVGLIRNLADCEQRSIHREIQAVLTVVAEGGVAVVDAGYDVGPRGRSYFDKSSPGVSGIGGRTGGVDEDAFWIAIEAVLYEHVVVGRNQEVVAGSDATESQFDAIIKQLLEVGHVDD